MRQHWPRLLIAGGVRVGSDVFYALIVVFSLTYVTTVLNLSRTLALMAIMAGSVVNALIIPFFGVLSDRVGRRAVYGAGAVMGMLWSFAFFVLADTGKPLLVMLAVIIGLIFQPPCSASRPPS